MSKRSGRKIDPIWWAPVMLIVIGGWIAVVATLYSGTFTSYVPLTLRLGQGRAGDGRRRQGEAARRGDRPRRLHRHRRRRGSAAAENRPRPVQIPAEQRRGGDAGPPPHSARSSSTSSCPPSQPQTAGPGRSSAVRAMSPSRPTRCLRTCSRCCAPSTRRSSTRSCRRSPTRSAARAIGSVRRSPTRITCCSRSIRGCPRCSGTGGCSVRPRRRIPPPRRTSCPYWTRCPPPPPPSPPTRRPGCAVAVGGRVRQSGVNVIGGNQPNLVRSLDVLEPTTDLLLKYSPTYTCMFQGAQWFLEHGGRDAMGGNGKSVVMDVALLLGDDPYHYPDNLPIVGAKGGPGGKPSCGSLPDPSANYPVRALVTNTGRDRSRHPAQPRHRLPGLGQLSSPSPARYPNRRASAYLFGGPAPGPIRIRAPRLRGAAVCAGRHPAVARPAAGATADGAEDPGPRPGSEPFVVQAPAQMQPTPLPPIPLPQRPRRPRDRRRPKPTAMRGNQP